MRPEVSQSELEAGKRARQDEGSPSSGKARGMCGKAAGPLGAWTKKGQMLVLASLTSAGDHRGQVASKMAQKYRREDFKEKELGSGPSPE